MPGSPRPQSSTPRYLSPQALALALAFALAVAPFLAACGEGGGPGASDVVVQDSAGVLLVTHPVDTQPGEWVADMAGRLLLPGEFQSINLLAPWPGDSILTFDLNLRRATIFAEDGSFGRSMQLEATEAAPFGNVRGAHGDGSLLATGFNPLFVRSTHVAVGPELMVVASNDRWDLRFFTPDGTLTHRVRLGDGPPPPVTEALRREATERALASSTSTREPAELRQIYEAMEVPTTLPAHARVVVDRLNHVWVERYAATPHPESEWLVFSPIGELAARVTLPARFTPQDIGVDYLLGVVRDDFDVEQVIRIPLAR